MSEKIFLCLVLVLFASVELRADVLHYSATLQPDIANKSIKGRVLIRVLTTSNWGEFNCGDLTIDSVTERGTPLQFSVNARKLRVSLGEKKGEREIEVRHHGAPRYGIRFFPDRQQVYTIFSTSQWMVCNDDPADKATLTMKLIR